MKEVTKEDGGFTALQLSDHNFEIPTTSLKERWKETWKQAYMV
jgi:hypothetical protein